MSVCLSLCRGPSAFPGLKQTPWGQTGVGKAKRTMQCLGEWGLLLPRNVWSIRE